MPCTGHTFPSCRVLCSFMDLTSFLSPALQYGNVVLALELSEKHMLQHLQYTVCVCFLGNGAAVTKHISLMELQSLLLSLCASQASACSRSNRSFVSVKPTLGGQDFYSSNLRSAFSNGAVHRLPGNASVVTQQ